MKFVIVFVSIFLFSIVKTFSSVGCSDGTYIYTSPNGTYLQESQGVLIPRYSTANKIYIRNWDADPTCGILREIVNKYSTASGTTSNPNSKCIIGTGSAYGSRLLDYNPNDSSCVVKNVPIDQGICLLMLTSILLGVFFIAKKPVNVF